MHTSAPRNARRAACRRRPCSTAWACLRYSSAFAHSAPPPVRLFRLIKIVSVGLRFGLDRMVLDADSSGRLARLWNVLFFWRRFREPRAVRLRRALESLGPIFVKFGQMLSTRRDLLPPDLADELALLQDRVPPFRSEERRVGKEC